MASDSLGSQTPIAMKGGGFYNKHSSVQGEAASVVKRLMERFAELLPYDHSTPSKFMIADYGSSQGANSVPVVKQAIKILREKDSNNSNKREIQVLHTDLPHNDYSELFNTVLGNRGYCIDHENVFPIATAISFYKRLAPKESTHLGFTMTATHWLSDTEFPSLKDKVKSFRSMVSVISATNINGELDDSLIPVVHDAIREKSMNDWKSFLSHRSDELAPGALLFSACLGPIPSDVPISHTFDRAHRKLVEEGHITEEEFHSFIGPFYFLSVSELTCEQVVPKNLKLVHNESLTLQMPIWENYLITKDHKQAAMDHTNFIRAWSEAIMRGWLSKMGRSQQDIERLIPLIYEKFQQVVEEDPSQIQNMTSRANLLVFQKAHSS